MSDLGIIGSFPPPNGGVATHVQRLLPLLRDRNISFRVYNAVSESASPPNVISVARWRRLWLISFLLTCKENGLLILSDRISVWCLSLIICHYRKKKVAIRLRNSVLLDNVKRGGWRRNLLSYVIRRFDLVICVNHELEDKVLEIGAPRDRVIHAPGFLPPTKRCMDEKMVDPSVWEFLKDKHPILSANGKVRWYQGTDLYGLDLLIDLVAELKGEYPNIALIVCFWDHNSKDDERVNELNKKANILGLSDSILFNLSSGVFLPVLANSNVFVRPTATDGDANSVREALAMGVPVVASDVVVRPEGCFIHANRDLASIVDQTRAAIRSIHFNKVGRKIVLPPQSKIQIDNYVERLATIAN